MTNQNKEDLKILYGGIGSSLCVDDIMQGYCFIRTLSNFKIHKRLEADGFIKIHTHEGDMVAHTLYSYETDIFTYITLTQQTLDYMIYLKL